VAASKAVTVLNGIPVDRFAHTSLDQRARARAALGLSDDDLVVGCVGRLVPLKNHQLVLSCLPRLLLLHPGLKVAFIGEGPLLDDLRALAQSLGVSAQVVFAGAHADVAGLLPALDVFALPSRTEGLSIALLEACAAGLPIVATAVGGNPEIIKDGLTGLLVGSDDAESLRSAVHEMLANGPMRERLGAAALQWVQENGSVESMRHNYEMLYTAAIDGRRPQPSPRGKY
jgi:glycosyltransferase involved in cell wall biosynthesis